jgi:hypothetical protein
VCHGRSAVEKSPKLCRSREISRRCAEVGLIGSELEMGSWIGSGAMVIVIQTSCGRRCSDTISNYMGSDTLTVAGVSLYIIGQGYMRLIVSRYRYRHRPRLVYTRFLDNYNTCFNNALLLLHLLSLVSSRHDACALYFAKLSLEPSLSFCRTGKTKSLTDASQLVGSGRSRIVDC